MDSGARRYYARKALLTFAILGACIVIVYWSASVAQMENVYPDRRPPVFPPDYESNPGTRTVCVEVPAPNVTSAIRPELDADGSQTSF